MQIKPLFSDGIMKVIRKNDSKQRLYGQKRLRLFFSCSLANTIAVVHDLFIVISSPPRLLATWRPWRHVPVALPSPSGLVIVVGSCLNLMKSAWSTWENPGWKKGELPTHQLYTGSPLTSIYTILSWEPGPNQSISSIPSRSNAAHPQKLQTCEGHLRHLHAHWPTCYTSSVWNEIIWNHWCNAEKQLPVARCLRGCETNFQQTANKAWDHGTISMQWEIKWGCDD